MTEQRGDYEFSSEVGQQKSGVRRERRAENEASVLRRLVEMMLEFQTEQVRQVDRERFWKNIRWFAVAAGFALMALANILSISKLTGMGNLPLPKDGEYVSMVRIEGMIAPGKPAASGKIVAALEEAFEDEQAKGVLLLINSPGGTPVQSAIIHHEINRFKKKYPEKKVIAVAEDMLASGAYYVASAADEIYANENSIVGSIGVKIETYGAVDLARKLGVERRIFAAGEHKVRLDMLEPLRPEDKRKFEHTLSRLHQNFIDAVKQGRGEKLTAADDTLFTGDFWTAPEAREMGLIDGINTPDGTLEEAFGVTDVRDYTPAPGLFTSLMKSTLDAFGWAEAGIPRPYYQF